MQKTASTWTSLKVTYHAASPPSMSPRKSTTLQAVMAGARCLPIQDLRCGHSCTGSQVPRQHLRYGKWKTAGQDLLGICWQNPHGWPVAPLYRHQEQGCHRRLLTKTTMVKCSHSPHTAVPTANNTVCAVFVLISGSLCPAAATGYSSNTIKVPSQRLHPVQNTGGSCGQLHSTTLSVPERRHINSSTAGPVQLTGSLQFTVAHTNHGVS